MGLVLSAAALVLSATALVIDYEQENVRCGLSLASWLGILTEKGQHGRDQHD